MIGASREGEGDEPDMRRRWAGTGADSWGNIEKGQREREKTTFFCLKVRDKRIKTYLFPGYDEQVDNSEGFKIQKD